ncbi:hypothetical protein OHB12_03860 [Nocardia sp. NBC_01730]|nr:hypothetical protein OHB12_03860 [Nocardia sp. NBC_01730]
MGRVQRRAAVRQSRAFDLLTKHVVPHKRAMDAKTVVERVAHGSVRDL